MQRRTSPDIAADGQLILEIDLVKYTFLSPLEIDECVGRLTDFISKQPPLGFSFDYPRRIVGKIDGHKFMLRVARYKSAFAFYGTLRTCRGGTLVGLDYRMLSLTKAILGFLLGSGFLASCGSSAIWVAVGVGVLAVVGGESGWGNGELFASLVGFLALGLSFPLVWGGFSLLFLLLSIAGGKFRETRDVKRISAFMEETLQARRIERSEVARF